MNKVCPFFLVSNLRSAMCIKDDCAFWCDFGGDCAVPLLAEKLLGNLFAPKLKNLQQITEASLNEIHK